MDQIEEVMEILLLALRGDKWMLRITLIASRGRGKLFVEGSVS